jgi:hypothetical protein
LSTEHILLGHHGCFVRGYWLICKFNIPGRGINDRTFRRPFFVGAGTWNLFLIDWLTLDLWTLSGLNAFPLRFLMNCDHISDSVRGKKGVGRNLKVVGFLEATFLDLS